MTAFAPSLPALSRFAVRRKANGRRSARVHPAAGERSRLPIFVSADRMRRG